MLTVALVAGGILVGAITALKIIAPITHTSTDDKILALLERVPLDKLTDLISKKRV